MQEASTESNAVWKQITKRKTENWIVTWHSNKVIRGLGDKKQNLMEDTMHRPEEYEGVIGLKEDTSILFSKVVLLISMLRVIQMDSKNSKHFGDSYTLWRLNC